MKKVYTLTFSLLFSAGLLAQSYYSLPAIDANHNPRGLNNEEEQFAEAGWSNIMTQTTSDSWSSTETIPFSFQFDGSAVSSYKVSNTGVLTFSTSATAVPSNPPQSLPSASIPDNSICAWGLDLTGANDVVRTKTFGSAPNRQHWTMWASASHTGLTGSSAWTYWSIVLEEGTNRIYVVDQRTYDSDNGNVAMTVGVQVDGSDATEIAGSPTLGSNTTATGGPSETANPDDNTWYEFGEGSLATTDMEAIPSEMPSIVGINTPVSIDARFQNRGTASVTSFDLNYSVDNASPVTSSESQSIASGDFASATVGTWTAPAAGSYTIKVWADNINGSTDENPEDDTLTFVVQAAASVPRNILAEEFSSSTCPPCLTWNTNVYNAALADYNKFNNTIVVKYQVPIPVAGDPSHNADGDDRRAYYGVNAAPSMVMNGGLVDYQATTWAGVSAEYAQLETDALAEPAFVEIRNAVADYNGSGNSADISVSADIHSNIDLSGGDYRAQIIVMQKEYVFSGATNGDFNYSHVMRKMLPTPSGIPLSVNAGSSQNISESHSGFTIGNVTEFSYNLWNHNVEVVINVENTATKTILNAEMATINLVGLDETSLLKASVFPNPANDQLFIGLEEMADFQVVLTNSIGQVVAEQSVSNSDRTSIDTERIAAGVYLLSVTSGNKTSTQRISISH